MTGENSTGVFPPRPQRTVWLLTLSAGVALLVAGCPASDPYTESRLVNRSAQPIEVQVELEAARYGVDSRDTAVRYAPDWLREFGDGEGVEVVKIEAASLTGTYRIAADGFMVAHASLGRSPYIRFKRLTISRNDRSLIYTGVDAIVRQFRPIEDKGYRYEFPVTDAMLDAAPHSPAARVHAN